MSTSKKDKTLSEAESGLQAVRAEIDSLDQVILRAIEDRAALAAKVLMAKSGQHTFRPGREADLIRNLARNTSLPAQLVEQTWRGIIAHNLSSQALLKIARLDTEAVAVATKFRFSTNHESSRYPLPGDVVDAVARGDVQFGVVPDWQEDDSWLSALKSHRQNGLDIYISAYTHMIARSNVQQAVIISTTLPDPSSADMTLAAEGGKLKMIEGYHPDMEGVLGIVQICDIS
jgi:chorismate mutase